MCVSRQLQRGHIEVDGWDSPPAEGWWPRFIRWLSAPTQPETDAVPVQHHAPEVRTQWVGGTPWVSATKCECHRLEHQTLHAVRIWWQNYFHETPPELTLDTELTELAVDSLDMLDLYASLEESLDVLIDASSRPTRISALVDLIRTSPHPMLAVA